jgi:4-hydroxybutyrate CoA-transferase
VAWRDDYKSKLRSPTAALQIVKSGDHVYMGGNAATPAVLAHALAARAPEISGVEVAHVLLLGKDPFAEVRDHVRHRALFVGPADRDAVNAGRADYVPCHLSEIPDLLRDGTFPVDVALLMVSPPDEHGFLSLGVEVLASLAAAHAAPIVIVQVNKHMPRVLGNTFLHVSEVSLIVEADEPLAELEAEAPTHIEAEIARHLVPLIPDRATLQLGIGGIPNAVMSLLRDRDDIGIHSEMVSDGVMEGVRRGVITGRYKTLYPRKVIGTFMLGSRELYDWVHDNPQVEGHPCDTTNDIFVAAKNDRLVAINSAISVDLSGQVNSDSIGSRIYSGVGGQVDFIRAAWRSVGGQPIIALPSTARGGSVSRIVPYLSQGAGVVTSRADVYWVVTEWGAARLHGRTLRERAEALAEISHPQFRDELRAAARARAGAIG